jgi:SAM-dependent methyltransferase
MKIVKNRIKLLEELPKNIICVELGVLSGEFSKKILEIVSPKELYLVDIFSGKCMSGDHDGKNIKEYDLGDEYERLVELYSNNSVIRFKKSLSDVALREFAENSIDFVYIDTDHTFETTFRELELSFHKLKPGGFLCGHDYSIRFPGCKKAVDLFCSIYGQDIEILTEEDGMPSFLIKINKENLSAGENLCNLILKKEYSLLSPGRFKNLQNQIDYILENNIEGSIVETGVWKGGAIIFAFKYLEYLNSKRKVIACDSFQGLPEPTAEDYLHTGEHSREINFSELSISKQKFIENINSFGIDQNKIQIHEGWFKDTLFNITDTISILRLDGDYYESTMTALDMLYDKVSPGGVIIIDDYYWWKGCKKAVHDFFEKRGLEIELHKTHNDTTEVWFKKQLMMMFAQTTSKPKTELCELFYKWGSDKCPQIYHSYSEYYFDILKEYRYKFNSIVEIGIGSEELMKPIVGENYTIGASLRAWRDFFPFANVYGLDIETSNFFVDDRIQCVFTDQSDSDQLNQTFSKILTFDSILGIDLIVDDGSHLVSDMVLSFQTLYKFLNTGGIYIIEDIKKNEINIFESMDLQGGEIIKSFPGNVDWDGFIAIRKN